MSRSYPPGGYPYVGGEIPGAGIDVSDDVHLDVYLDVDLDLEREAAAAYARD